VDKEEVNNEQIGQGAALIKDGFSINGVCYTRRSLLKKCSERLSGLNLLGFERDVYMFIQQWLDTKDTMNVSTSGSTGAPKVMRVDKAFMVASALQTQRYFQYASGASILLCLSAEYIAGKMMIVRAMVSGLDLWIQDPSSSPKIERDYAMVSMVPMQVLGSVRCDEDLAIFEKVDYLLVGGAGVESDFNRIVRKLPCQVVHSYGMAETLSHIALRNLTNEESGYTLLSGVNVLLDERGCLLIDAPHLGVHDLQTNDLAEFSNDGSFRVLGRIDHLINSGGVNVIPEIVEERLKPLFTGECMREFFLFGLADDVLGQKVCLMIEGKSPQSDVQQVGEKQLISAMHELVKPYEIPRELYYLDVFPRTSSGKVKRSEAVRLIL